MKNTISLIFCLFAFLSAVSQSTETVLRDSDNFKQRRLEWTNIGVGVSYDNDSYNKMGANLGMDYNWKTKKVTYQAGLNASVKTISSSTLLVLNAGIGKSIVSKYFNFSLVAGPGLMWGKFETVDFGETQLINACLSGNGQVVYKACKNAGFGFELFVNVAKTQYVTGVRLVLHLND